MKKVIFVIVVILVFCSTGYAQDTGERADSRYDIEAVDRDSMSQQRPQNGYDPNMPPGGMRPPVPGQFPAMPGQMPPSQYGSSRMPDTGQIPGRFNYPGMSADRAQNQPGSFEKAAKIQLSPLLLQFEASIDPFLDESKKLDVEEIEIKIGMSPRGELYVVNNEYENFITIRMRRKSNNKPIAPPVIEGE